MIITNFIKYDDDVDDDEIKYKMKKKIYKIEKRSKEKTSAIFVCFSSASFPILFFIIFFLISFFILFITSSHCTFVILFNLRLYVQGYMCIHYTYE